MSPDTSVTVFHVLSLFPHSHQYAITASLLLSSLARARKGVTPLGMDAGGDESMARAESVGPDVSRYGCLRGLASSA